MTPCEMCARNGRSCCVNRQIVLTPGDVSRITASIGRSDFQTYETPEPAYAGQDDDPDWKTLTERKDGSRCILRRADNGNCFFLGNGGCSLVLDVRPLLCRVHPYLFTSKCVECVDMECPIANVHSPDQTLEQIGMPLNLVKQWHRMIYDELRTEMSQLQQNDEAQECDRPLKIGTEGPVSGEQRGEVARV